MLDRTARRKGYRSHANHDLISVRSLRIGSRGSNSIDLRTAARRKDPAQLERLHAIRAERFALMAALAQLPEDT